jgi:hypothetical protein
VIDIVARICGCASTCSWSSRAWHRLGYPDGLYGADEMRHGIHAGDVETSLMLAFRPDTVRMDKAEHFVPRTVAMERDLKHLRAIQPTGFGWMAQDLNPKGAMGDAASATAEKGAASADFGAAPSSSCCGTWTGSASSAPRGASHEALLVAPGARRRPRKSRPPRRCGHSPHGRRGAGRRRCRRGPPGAGGRRTAPGHHLRAVRSSRPRPRPAIVGDTAMEARCATREPRRNSTVA